MFNIGLRVAILSFIDLKMAVLGYCVAFMQNKDLTDNRCVFEGVYMDDLVYKKLMLQSQLFDFYC